MGLSDLLVGHQRSVVCDSACSSGVMIFSGVAACLAPRCCACSRVSFDLALSPPDSWWPLRGQPPRFRTLLIIAA